MGRLFTALSLFVFACVATPAAAQNISYALTGNTSSGESFSITGLADTSAVAPFGVNSTILFVTLSSNIISVGSNTGSITGDVSFFNNQGLTTAGFSIIGGGGDFVNFSNTLFGSFDLISALGPVAVDRSFTRAFATTFGSVNLGGSTNLGFQAITVSQAVPEPSTWAMMLLGFGGVGVAMRRRRKSANNVQLA